MEPDLHCSQDPNKAWGLCSPGKKRPLYRKGRIFSFPCNVFVLGCVTFLRAVFKTDWSACLSHLFLPWLRSGVTWPVTVCPSSLLPLPPPVFQCTETVWFLVLSDYVAEFYLDTKLPFSTTTWVQSGHMGLLLPSGTSVSTVALLRTKKAPKKGGVWALICMPNIHSQPFRRFPGFIPRK